NTGCAGGGLLALTVRTRYRKNGRAALSSFRLLRHLGVGPKDHDNPTQGIGRPLRKAWLLTSWTLKKQFDSCKSRSGSLTLQLRTWSNCRAKMAAATS